jgi:hypothetical protein
MEDRDDVIDGRDDNAEGYLTTETVKGTSLALKSVDDVEGGDGLALGVLSVGDGITDDTLEEGLQYTTGLFVDHCEEDALVLCCKRRTRSGQLGSAVPRDRDAIEW